VINASREKTLQQAQMDSSEITVAKSIEGSHSYSQQGCSLFITYIVKDEVHDKNIKMFVDITTLNGAVEVMVPMWVATISNQ
jgi:hypothetical protein